MQVPSTRVQRFPGNENPYIAWTTFSRAIADTFSRAPVISQHGKGLLGTLLTPAKYASLPGVLVGEAYTPYPHPGDDSPAAAAAFFFIASNGGWLIMPSTKKAP